MKKNRNIQIDMFKGFAIIAIVLWHAGIIPTWSFVWAIPTFVFSTSALYYRSLDRLEFKKIAVNFIWIFGLGCLFTSLLYFLGVHQIGAWQDISLSPTFWVLRNPYLGNLWYFLLYFQLLILLLVAKYIKINFNFLKKRWIGLSIFLFGEAVSYILLFKFGQGVSLNIFSWLFIVWLGIVFYKEVANYIYDIFLHKKINFYLINVSVILLNAVVLLVGSAPYQIFLSSRTHDFIYPTFILQLSYLWLLFSATTILEKTWPKLASIIAMAGKYSLYIYLFHVVIADLFLYSFGPWGYVLSLPLSIATGYYLQRLYEKVFKK